MLPTPPGCVRVIGAGGSDPTTTSGAGAGPIPVSGMPYDAHEVRDAKHHLRKYQHGLRASKCTAADEGSPLKGYRQFCSVSRALDVLGDRWAMLVVRELLLGPRRYTDLLSGLPGLGTSVLAVRLHELEEANLVTRKKLPPPAASTVYELTREGADLRPMMDALARWGLRLMDRPKPGEALRGSWMAYSLAVSLPPTVLPADAELEARIDGEPHTFSVRADRLEARSGTAQDPLAVVASSIVALYLLVTGQSDRAELQARSEFVITGDNRIAERFLDAAYEAWLSPNEPASGA